MKVYKMTLAVLMIVVTQLFLFACAGTDNQTELTLSAASSLTEPLAAIARSYEKEHPQVKLTLNFGSSGSLSRQIQQGASVDVFISAAKNQMDPLEEAGLLDAHTRVDLLTNQLVLVVPSDSAKTTTFHDLANEDVKGIAMGEPDSVPAGTYAKEMFVSLDLWEVIDSKIVFGKDVRSVLAWVETGNADAGMVYLSDALTSKKVRVMDQAPEGTHMSIIYPAAVIAGSKHLQEAKVFMDYLKSEKAASTFESYGFTCIR